MTDIYVNASGPALSFLLYENVKSIYDQEGFLTGEIINHITDSISDSQISNQKKETFINISSLIPLPNNVDIYDNIGEINEKNLKNFIKTKDKEIVGWYSFRRNCSLTPFLRTKLIYKQLLKLLSPKNPELFVMCLLNTVINHSGSTHIFNLKFTRFKHGKLENIPMKILNLGETSQSVYKTLSSTSCLSDTFNNIVSKLNIENDKCSDNILITKIQKSLQDYLQNLVSDIEESELALEKLENEVKSLKESEKLSNEVLLPHLLSDITETPSPPPPPPPPSSTFDINKKKNLVISSPSSVIKAAHKDIQMSAIKCVENTTTTNTTTTTTPTINQQQTKSKSTPPPAAASQQQQEQDPFYYVSTEMRKEMNKKPIHLRQSPSESKTNSQFRNRRPFEGSMNKNKIDKPTYKVSPQQKKSSNSNQQ